MDSAVRAYLGLDLTAQQPRPARRPRGRALQLPTAQIDDLTVRYAAGATTRQLAAAFGIHRHTVSKHLRDRDVQTVNRLSEADVRTSIELYAQGW